MARDTSFVGLLFLITIRSSFPDDHSFTVNHANHQTEGPQIRKTSLCMLSSSCFMNAGGGGDVRAQQYFPLSSDSQSFGVGWKQKYKDFA